MAHELDINEGEASFVSARVDAWHQLGEVLPESFTAEQAMKHGKLGGWKVRKTPLLAVVDQGPKKPSIQVPVPGRYAIVRNNPVVRGQVDALSTVGDAYHVIQNEEHAGLLNALIDESGAHFETAGALDGGRRVFITMKLPGHIDVGGVDPIDSYLAAVNTHDGSMSFTLMVTPIRIVCQNTMNLAFGQSSHMFRVRHTSGSGGLILAEARKALDMTFNYLDGFQEEANQLIDTAMTQAAFEKLIYKEFGPGKEAAPATVTRTENKLDEMARLFADSHTHAGVRNTAWAGLNAITEWADHYSPARGDNGDVNRSLRSVFDPTFKNQALQVIRKAAKVKVAA